MELALCTILGIGLIGVGAVCFVGQGLPRMRFYKEMPAQERATIRFDRLGRNLGIDIALCGAVFLLCGAVIGEVGQLFRVLMVAWVVLSIADCIFIGKAQRYTTVAKPKRKKPGEEQERSEAVEASLKMLMR